jgi:hypothetical protein
VRSTAQRFWMPPSQSGAVASVVSSGGGGGSLAFASEWANSTGAGETAVRDGTKWDVYNNYATANLLEVIASTGLDFPTTNCLRVNFNLENAGDVRIWNKWAYPASTGDGIYHRIYFRNAISDSFGTQSTGNVHQLEPSSGAGVPWGLKFGTNGSGGYEVFWYLAGVTPNSTFSLNGTLDKNVTYRIEWAFVRKSNGFFTPLIRIYNASNVLVYDTDDFRDDVPTTLTAKNPDVDLSATSDSGRVFGRELFVGNNGPSWTVTTGNYQYFAAAAVSVTDWCGAYVEGEAD